MVRRGWPATVVFTLALTACSSGGGDSNGASSPARSATSVPTAASDCQARAGLSGQVSDHGTAQASGTTIDLGAGDFFFEPTCVVVGAGGTLTVSVKNEGQALHNLSITTLGVDEDVKAGESITVSVSYDGSTPLPFFCKYHVGAGMQGAFLPA